MLKRLLLAIAVLALIPCHKADAQASCAASQPCLAAGTYYMQQNAVYNFVYATTQAGPVPTVQLSGLPANPSSNLNPTITWTVAPSSTPVYCRLDSAALVKCPVPWSLGLGVGPHRIEFYDGPTTGANLIGFYNWVSTMAPGVTWTLLGPEYASFTLPTPKIVRFGTDLAFTTKTLPAGNYVCNVATFLPDPAVGANKSCYASSATP